MATDVDGGEDMIDGSTWREAPHYYVLNGPVDHAIFNHNPAPVNPVFLTPFSSSETPAFGVYVGVGLRSSRRVARGGVPVACLLRRRVRDRHCHLPQAGGYTRLTLRSLRPPAGGQTDLRHLKFLIYLPIWRLLRQRPN